MAAGSRLGIALEGSLCADGDVFESAESSMDDEPDEDVAADSATLNLGEAAFCGVSVPTLAVAVAVPADEEEQRPVRIVPGGGTRNYAESYHRRGIGDCRMLRPNMLDWMSTNGSVQEWWDHHALDQLGNVTISIVEADTAVVVTVWRGGRDGSVHIDSSAAIGVAHRGHGKLRGTHHDAGALTKNVPAATLDEHLADGV